ncbi:hypothetical protein DFJ73DRAFT_610269, partial [Zopfochytrium polystomum]
MKLAFFFYQEASLFSDPVKVAILDLLHQLGVENVPSLSKIKRVITDCVDLCGNEPKKALTSTNKVIHHNSI